MGQRRTTPGTIRAALARHWVRPAAAGLDRRVPGFYGALCRHCTLPRLGLHANYTGTAREKAAMRIAIGTFMYEANSFSPVQTTLDDFAAGTLVARRGHAGLLPQYQ